MLFFEIVTLTSLNVHLYSVLPFYKVALSWEPKNLVSKGSIHNSLSETTLNQFNETSNKPRSIRSSNPIFRYDYKVGNYLTKDDATTMSFLFTTINEITGGIRKSTWFFSKTFLDLFNDSFQKYTLLVQKPFYGIGTKHSAIIQPTYSIFNFFSSNNDFDAFINTRYQSIAALDQKFAKMFLTSSLQQRIFAN